MLVFTDGEDQGSHASLADVERQLEASGVSLYVIGRGRALKIPALKETVNRLATLGGRAIITEGRRPPERIRRAYENSHISICSGTPRRTAATTAR